jgi:hypothetical protein
MMMIEDREFDGAPQREPTDARATAPFLIDTEAIRNEANLLKIKERDRF